MVAGMTGGMGSKKLRVIADPFVVAPPTGARIRTRIRPNDAEAAALARIGQFLGELSRRDLSQRLALGRVSGKDDLRAERKQGLTSNTSSRWAGAITRASNDQYALGMRGLSAERDSLTAAINVLTKRTGVPVGARDVTTRTKGYRDERERFAKTRRLNGLRHRLAAVEARAAAARPPMVVGGNRLWRNGNRLEEANLTEQQWRSRFEASRRFMTADGETGKMHGNETIRLTPDGRVSIKIPAALVGELGLGTHLRIAEPVVFSYRHGDWSDRVTAHQAVRYDITFDAESGRWYVDASWKTPPVEHVPTVAQLRSQRHLGVDLNADHFAAVVIDSSGNPVGNPYTVALVLTGLPASTRDAYLCEAISHLIRIARDTGCGAIAVENLNFVDARMTGRETMGRGKRGRTFRRTVAAIPTANFRERLVAMAYRSGLWIMAVDPAYTSRFGHQHWTKPLQQQSSASTVTRHHGAAAAIGRRSHDTKIGRRKPGLRQRQRTPLNHPQSRPDRKAVTTDDRNKHSPHLPRQPRRPGSASATDHQLPKPFGEHTEQNSLTLSV